MNRSRFPTCSRCKLNYSIGDRNGFKVPMLLSCGHDLCRGCLNYKYKKEIQVVCDVCGAYCKIKNHEELNQIPIHYYLVGKVWCLMFNKQKEMLRDICNLKMTNLTSESSKEVKKNCQVCHKYPSISCLQCNDVYCNVCFSKVHEGNQIMSHHDFEKLEEIHPALLLESKCDVHSKLIEFICVTCRLLVCTMCVVNNHRLHDIQPLEEYNKNNVQLLNEYTSKGEILIRKLKQYKSDFEVKMQKSLDAHSKKKKSDFDNKKNEVMMFVSALVGAIQRVELNVLDTINQSETSIVQSINKIINHLSSSIDDLQLKLNQIDLMLNNHQYLAATMANFTVDIERALDTTYCIGKKNKVKTSIFYNSNIFDAIKQCIVPSVDVSDTYILTNTPDFSSNYTLIRSTIKSENNESAPMSSHSSLSNVSTSSYHSSKYSDGIYTQKLDASSIRVITKNKIMNVDITHINSPSDFYLQLHDNSTTLQAVSNEVNKFVQKNQSEVQCIEMDNVMYAVQLSTNKWCRGVVVHICNENDYNLYTVHCIDYGFTETITSNKIRNVPASVAQIPSLAFNCALYDLKPNATGWSNEAYQLFRDLITQEKTISYFIYPIETYGERIEVDVICNGIHPMSIRDAMLYLGYGSTENYMTIALREKFLNKITLPSDKILLEGLYSITISHLYSPSEFYFRINEDDQSLTQIMKTLETMYKPTEKDSNKSYLLYTPQIGMAVAARYSIDDTWYRAKIISLPESRMVTIYYIDFGNSETLPWDQLRVLDPSLITTPPLAIKSLLADVYPSVDGIECTNWSDNAIAAFFNLVKNHGSIDDNLTAKVLFVDDDSHKVILYNHTSRGEVCINSKLISQGYGMRSDPESYSFARENVRTHHYKRKTLHTNSRNKSVILSTEDTLAFVKPWSIVEDVNHSWSKTENSNKDVPGVEMSIVKVVSPDEITLKLLNYNPAILIKQMNRLYKDKKLRKEYQQAQWQINDRCAVYIKGFGNWYRGKILNLDIKNVTASVLLYDLNQVNHGIPVNSLYTLAPNIINEKCGFIHCCMDKLVPLGVSDNKWPKFSCDRLIEELKRYPIVYFSKTGKKDDMALGEIWVKEIQMPEALKPVCERWINMNTFMIEQGFAISNKQNAKIHENLIFQSESELDQSFKYDMATSCWLPPLAITKSRFNAYVTYVDMNCHIYLQDTDSDSETPQLLKNISEELNSVFFNTQPEPMNVKWCLGQMVIVRYHLDKLWYRGTITEIEENEKFSVQFLDYGNTETCSREDLRSTLYMTDIPQLCFKGFFTSILPMEKDKKWSSDTLDFLHLLIVEQVCTVTIDLSTSSSLCAISKLTTGKPPQDVCQHLVTHGWAYFCYASHLNLFDSICAESNTADEMSVSGQSSNAADGRVSSGSRHAAAAAGKEDNYDVVASDVDDQVSCSSVVSSATAAMRAEKDECGDDEMSTTTNYDEQSDADPEQSSGYLRFSLDSNEMVEGTLCRVVSPVRMTLMIKKIGGIDIAVSKNNMQTTMLHKCAKLQMPDNIVPGMAVVILHNFLWRRGTVSDDAKSVFLVDFGIFVKLVKSNVRLCPAEFFTLPMFSIDCQLVNVLKSEGADAKVVVEKMSKLLKGINLKIVWLSELADDDGTVNVELYNDAGEIAYQPLIDSGLLITM